MSTATAPDRLRQIAILVSSVDAAAGRQILLHLPTDTARRVRALASQLGPVSAEEKRKILAEFQRSAAHAEERPAIGPSPISTPQPVAMGSQSAAGNAADSGWRSAMEATAQQPLAHSWVQLKPAALLRFVRQERPAVTAVVLSQLEPAVAAEVLQQLPPETSREVLLRLSRLEEIDPEAMRAIDEHLSQRLTEYQHHINSEVENSRRMESLLAAAPSHVRQLWAGILLANGDDQAAARYQPPPAQTEDVLDIGVQVASPAARHVVTEQHDQDSLREDPGQEDAHRQSRADAPRRRAEQQPQQTVAISPEDLQEVDSLHADLLPFPNQRQHENPNAFDRSLIQFQFEEILNLPPATLARVLSTTDSQFVLLALAGATPSFTKRFMNMLDRRDAKILQNRLQRIGPIRLRDVDEAQRRIVEHAAQFTEQRATQPAMEIGRRAVA